MAERADDPLDDPMELLESDPLDGPEEAAPPEPDPSPLPPLPLLSDDPLDAADAAAPPPEPAGATLEEHDPLLSSGDDAEWPEEEEPPGDDLSWADEEEGEPSEEGPSLPDEDGADPGEVGHQQRWVEEEAPTDEGSAELWSSLEDEHVRLVGYEELSELPALGRAAVLSCPDPSQSQSTLYTRDPSLVVDAEVETLLRLGGLEVVLRLRIAALPTAEGEEHLVLGRDALGGRFLIDPGRRRVVSPD